MHSCVYTCIHIQNVYSENLRHFTLDDCTAPDVSALQENGSWISDLVPENIQMLIYFQNLSYKYERSINIINLIIFLENLILCI